MSKLLAILISQGVTCISAICRHSDKLQTGLNIGKTFFCQCQNTESYIPCKSFHVNLSRVAKRFLLQRDFRFLSYGSLHWLVNVSLELLSAQIESMSSWDSLFVNELSMLLVGASALHSLSRISIICKHLTKYKKPKVQLSAHRHSSASILQSHDDREVGALMVKEPYFTLTRQMVS